MELSAIAPELRRRSRWFPPMPLGSALGRRVVRALTGLTPPRRTDGVTVETIDTPATSVRLYRPDIRRGDAALLWIHGGGYVIGSPVLNDALCGETCRTLGITVVSAAYRLGPEHPFPAPANDCFAAWTWLQESAAALGVDPRRIAIGGQSAGGGLAAGLVQRVHDAAGNRAAAQWLFSPMLDDRTAARRELDGIGHRVWNNRLNAIGWRSFLGSEPGAGRLPPYAVPARRETLEGLPPTWIGVGTIDLFHDEDRAYAERLRQAGVDVTFEAVAGAPHGFEAWGMDTRIAMDYLAAAQDWLRRTLDRL